MAGFIHLLGGGRFSIMSQKESIVEFWSKPQTVSWHERFWTLGGGDAFQANGATSTF